MGSIQQEGASTLLGPLARSLQQPSVRWLLLAGLGTSSLFLASRFTLFSFHKSTHSPDLKGAEPSPPKSPPPASRTKKERQKDDAELVAIFWDVDNCAPPTGSSGRSVALAVRSSIQKLQSGPIVSFKAYLELSSETTVPNAAQVQLRSELQGCGVSLIDTPKSGRKDVADKMMITDLLAFAIDQPAPATIVLISGDRDFAYPLGILRNRGYEVVLIVPPIGAVPILEASANVVMSWRQDVLGVEHNAAGKAYSSYSHQGLPTSSKTSLPNKSALSAAPLDKQPYPLPPHERRPSIRTMETFGSLISLLEQLRKDGQSKPLRSHVAARLVSMDRNVYTRAGASRWGEFAAVAEAAGIVTLGSSSGPGTEWVALKDTTRSHAKPAVTSIALPSTPVRNKPPTSASLAPLPSKSVDLRPFHPLIEICKELMAQGNPRPLCSAVAAQIVLLERKGIVDTYAMAKVPNWTEYIAAAERAGIARLAHTNHAGVYAVALNSKYLSTQTSVLKSSASRATEPVANNVATALPPPNQNGSSTKTAEVSNDSTVKEDGTSKRTVIANGHEVPQIFGPLVNALLQQVAEGRSFSTDYYCQSIVANHQLSLGNSHLNVKTAEDFRQYIEAAVVCKIITTEPGYKPDVRHIRLHPRLVRPGAKSDASIDEINSGKNGHVAQSTQFGASTITTPVVAQETGSVPAARLDKSERIRQMDALRKETAEVLASLHSSSGNDANDRFTLLLKSIDNIYVQASADDAPEALLKPGIPKTKLAAEMTRQHTGPGGLGGFYQSLGSTGFTDYLNQAKDLGLVVVKDKDGNDIPEGISLMGLSEYTINV